MAGPKYKLNRTGFRKNLLQADFMVAEMRARAEKVKDAAEAIAPESSGDYKRSFKVRTRKRGGIHNDRAEARVLTDDPGALAIEFGHFTARDERGRFKSAAGVEAAVPFARGGTYVEGHYTLTRALEAAGD